MATITLSGRIVAKHDTTEHWNSDITFVPLKGEVIVYEDHETLDSGDEIVSVAGVKIGDGNAYLVDIPFLSDPLAQKLLKHEEDTIIHVSTEDRERWDNKLNYTFDGDSENLIFNRL